VIYTMTIVMRFQGIAVASYAAAPASNGSHLGSSISGDFSRAPSRNGGVYDR
jgi:hypothetical protein